MDRRSFLKKAATTAVAAPAAFAAVSYPGKTTHAQTKYRWRLAHSFGPTAPVNSTRLKALSEELHLMTKGAMSLKIFAGGELVPAFGVWDAVKEGSIQMMFSASYYWAGKNPATQFTCSVPFGMNTQQHNSWIYFGGGQELWDEFYAAEGLKPFLAGNTGTQMGGWFRKEIKSLDDYKGLKMRIPGLGGKVVAAVGGTVVLLPGPEIFPSLERGVIDACEWVGPLYDFSLGLHQAAKYYYSPGWHEPTTANELTINLKAWNSLPKELQQMVENCANRMNVMALAEFDARNAVYLKKILSLGKVQLRQFPADAIAGLSKAAEKINEQVADSDPAARKVYDHYKKFRDEVRGWHNLNEVAYQMALKSVHII